MAKMKFYLNIEGAKLRTLDDLRENFFADAVLAHYQSGKLAQWLDVWSYNDELEQVRAIQATDARGILAELCRIFDVEADLEDFEVDVPLDEYLAEKKEAAVQAEIQEQIKATTSEVNMEFFEGWIEDDKDGLKKKKLNDWIALFPPLMMAITHGDEIAVKTLIQNGADVNVVVTDKNYSYSVLSLAVQGDSSEIVQMLIDAGADVNAHNNNICHSDTWGYTALMYAERPEVIRILVKAGAQVNARNNLGKTVLMNAVSRYNSDIEGIKTLIELGADIEAKSLSLGQSVLMYAKEPEVIRVLVKSGVQVNARDLIGRTALMMKVVEADESNIEVIKTLIELGADVNVKDNGGETALMKAAFRSDNPQIIRILIDAGANINAQDNNGWTALDRANSSINENESIKAIIKAAGGRSGR